MRATLPWAVCELAARLSLCARLSSAVWHRPGLLAAGGAAARSGRPPLDQGSRVRWHERCVAVGDLTPVRSREFVRADVALGAFAGAPSLDPQSYRADLDAALDQDIAPRA